MEVWIKSFKFFECSAYLGIRKKTLNIKSGTITFCSCIKESLCRLPNIPYLYLCVSVNAHKTRKHSSRMRTDRTVTSYRVASKDDQWPSKQEADCEQNDRHLWKHYLPLRSVITLRTCRPKLPFLEHKKSSGQTIASRDRELQGFSKWEKDQFVKVATKRLAGVAPKGDSEESILHR